MVTDNMWQPCTGRQHVLQFCALAEAREEIELAREDSETTYFDESVKDAKMVRLVACSHTWGFYDIMTQERRQHNMRFQPGALMLRLPTSMMHDSVRDRSNHAACHASKVVDECVGKWSALLAQLPAAEQVGFGPDCMAIQ